MSKSFVYIFTGNGKGKTSAALGMVLRASCLGVKVGWVAWYKSIKWDISEKKVPQLLPTVDFKLCGEGFYIPEKTAKITSKAVNVVKTKPLNTGGNVVDASSAEAHKKAAEIALEEAKKMLQTQNYFLIVLDEICNALHDNLLTLNQIEELMGARGSTHLLLTGRNAPDDLINKADLVSEIVKIKHPYDKGIPAVKGLDF